MKKIFQLQTLIIFALGLIGVSQVWFADLGLAAMAQEAGISLEFLKIASMVQAAVLLLVAVVAGSVTSSVTGFTFNRVGKSERSNTRQLVIDLATAIALASVLLLFYNWLVTTAFPLETTNSYGDSIWLAVLYGGITEEVLVRWGVMGFIAYLFIKIFKRPKTSHNGDLIIWANIFAAMVFAIGHFPALALLGGVQPVHFWLVFSFNTLIGVLFGWLFNKHGLWSAMVAHGSAHLAVFGVMLLSF
jgi:hypothetical protein